MVEFAFGDVYARPGLGLRERQIATVAALTALATAPAQLKVHIAPDSHQLRDQLRAQAVGNGRAGDPPAATTHQHVPAVGRSVDVTTHLEA